MKLSKFNFFIMKNDDFFLIDRDLNSYYFNYIDMAPIGLLNY